MVAEKGTDKVIYLEAIRGVSAFLVFIHHFLFAFYPACYTYNLSDSHLNGLGIYYGKSVFSVFSNGHFFVIVFFVLSGYVLSRKYFLTNNTELLISGALRRFLRLYIPVAATLILAYLLLVMHLYYNGPVAQITHSQCWLSKWWLFQQPLQSLLYCLVKGTMFYGDSSFNSVLWTISYEFAGSLFVYAFLAFTHNTRNKLLSVLLVLLYCKLTNSYFTAAFMLGISLNFIETMAPHLKSTLTAIVVSILFLCGLILGSYPDGLFILHPQNILIQDTVFMHFPQRIINYAEWFHDLGAWFLVMAFVLSPALQRVISFWAFKFLGYISFSFYLIHCLVIGSFSCYLFLCLSGRFGYNHSVAIVFILTTLTCLILSWAMTKYIDEPGVKFSKYIYKTWFKKAEHADTLA
jgi:peptidoglycan/LPS O-acetylase OafA/YrhL